MPDLAVIATLYALAFAQQSLYLVHSRRHPPAPDRPSYVVSPMTRAFRYAAVLVYLAALALIPYVLYLDRVLSSVTLARGAVALAFGLTALALLRSSLSALGADFAACYDARLPATVVRRGPYRWAAHPIYLANLLLVCSFGIAVPHPGFALLGFVLLAFYARAACEEERAIRRLGLPPTAGPFFETINYSSCNEDWRTERRALKIGPADRVLAVTGSGDRPLHLLLDDPAVVTAIDANPCQGFLLHLKIAAIRRLDYEDYVSFLGLRPCDRRARMLEDLAPTLPPDAQAYWRARVDQVEAGVLYSGRFERHYRRVSWLARCLRGGAIRRLFAFPKIEEQRAFVRESWNRWWWRATFDLLCSPLWARVFLRDPAFYAHVAPGLRVGRYVHDGMMGILERFPARENFMLSLVFRGRLSEDDLPPYLAPDAFDRLRERVGRVEVITDDVVRFLARGTAARWTRFSLSDVPSYLDPGSFDRLCEGLVHAAAPRARFCIRQFLTGHRIREGAARRLRREPGLEEELRQEDRAFAYRFLVGEVAHEG